MPTEEAPKIRENRLRRMATRQGFLLRKIRRFDPRAIDYGGWRIVNARTGMIEAGEPPLNIDEVETFLTEGTAR
jgi:hypothetical protein